MSRSIVIAAAPAGAPSGITRKGLTRPAGPTDYESWQLYAGH